MFKNIRKNKIESGVIIGIFILVVTLIIYYVCNALRLGTFSIVIALIFFLSKQKIVVKCKNMMYTIPESTIIPQYNVKFYHLYFL